MAELRVLVADDEAPILDVMKAFFHRRGDHCDVATDGFAALRLVEEHAYDLVLSDLSMPGMNGLELTRRVKSLQPHAVCILMSGLGTRGDVISALKIGVFDFIDKPFTELAVLTMAVDRAAESGRLLRERDALLQNLREQNARLEYSLVRLHAAFGQLRQQEEAVASDLRKAQRVQRSFLPAGFPRTAGWEFFGYYAPAEQLGGDFFGTRSLTDGRLVLYLVDVAGHGVSAAMITVTFRELMRAGPRSATEGFLGDPPGVLRYLNEALLEERFEPPILVSMVYAVIDPRSGEVRVASAGHPAPILVSGPNRATAVSVGGVVLGTDAAASYTAARVQLNEGDALLFYSDGLSEARDASGREFSASWLQATAGRLHAHSARLMAGELERQLLAHLQGEAPADDVTFLVASRGAAATAGSAEHPGDLVPESVKIVAPGNPRPTGTGARGQISGGFRDDTFVVQLSGLVTWQFGPAFRELLDQAKSRAMPPSLVDLAACEALDSTMLGLLLQHAGEIVLHQPGVRVVEQLHEMGVLPHFTISYRECPQPKVAMAVPAADAHPACSELILSAHEALMEASAENRQKFKDVVDSLREEKAGRQAG